MGNMCCCSSEDGMLLFRVRAATPGVELSMDIERDYVHQEHDHHHSLVNSLPL